MAVKPFAVGIPKETLDDLVDRLATTRWPDRLDGAGWDYGIRQRYLKELTRYWQEEFDWPATEARLNRLDHFRAEIDGLNVHFIHARGQGENPMPLLLTHGWPDSFLRFEKLIPLLTNPAEHGGKDGDAFDLVIPSLPGFGFSDRPKEAGELARVPARLAALMTKELGYKRFGAHGGDWGSTITERLALEQAKSLTGIHLTDVPFAHLFGRQKGLTTKEKAFLAEARDWQQREGAYAMIQATKTQTLGVGLNDSPAGLAAWIVEKFRAWSDCGGDVEKRFSRDELLANITLYWATQTITSSMRYYHDAAQAPDEKKLFGTLRGWLGMGAPSGPVKVPTGFALFPKDIAPPPREWAERFFNVKRWTEMPRGGHFAALEEPQLLAEDIRAFFRPLRKGKYR